MTGSIYISTSIEFTVNMKYHVHIEFMSYDDRVT